jgi:hypothetical protein
MEEEEKGRKWKGKGRERYRDEYRERKIDK